METGPNEFIRHCRAIHYALLSWSLVLWATNSLDQSWVIRRAHTSARHLRFIQDRQPEEVFIDGLMKLAEDHGVCHTIVIEGDDLADVPECVGSEMESWLPSDSYALPDVWLDDTDISSGYPLPDLGSVGEIEELWEYLRGQSVCTVHFELSALMAGRPKTADSRLVRIPVWLRPEAASTNSPECKAELGCRPASDEELEYLGLTNQAGARYFVCNWSERYLGPWLVVRATNVECLDAQTALLRWWESIDVSSDDLLWQSIEVGLFDESFPEFAQATKNLRSLRIDELEQHLSWKSQRDTRSLSAFGFQGPLSLMRRIGLFVLLVFEVYFAGHIRALRMTLARDRDSIMSPWIALYRDWSSRTATQISAVVIPFSVGVSAAAVAAEQAEEYPLVVALAGITAALLPILVGIQLWRLSVDCSKMSKSRIGG